MNCVCMFIAMIIYCPEYYIRNCIMNRIVSEYSVSLSELKKNPMAIIKQSHGEAVAVLHYNIPIACLVPAAMYENMMELLSETELSQTVTSRLKDIPDAIEVDLDEL